MPSGQQEISYQSDKLKGHFQSGIKLSFSGCWEKRRGRGGSSQPTEVAISPPGHKGLRCVSAPTTAGLETGIDTCFPKDKGDESQAQPKREKDKELRLAHSDKTRLLNRLNTTLSTKTEGHGFGTCWPQSPSASESANFSSHLTSNGLSRAESSSIRCESSRSVGTLLVMVSCSVS